MDLDFDYKAAMRDKTMRPKYIAVSKVPEVAPTTGKLHVHGWIQFPNQVSSVKKVSHLLGKVWCEPMGGTLQQNDNYDSKDCEGQLLEWGQRPKQGDRNDLKAVVDRVQEGETTADQICIEDPVFFHMYGRTLQKAEDIALRKKYRTEMTEGIWLHGPTGSGKSHEVFKEFDPDTMYVMPLQDNGWCDGYTGQPIVILNDFRGEIKYNEMLNMIDKWPHWVKRRGREPVPFVAKKVYITSSLTPQEVYHGVLERNDNIDQLLRRLKISEVARKCSEGNNKTSEQKNIDLYIDFQ